MALNVPGPVAVARALADGANAVKVEPPGGDALATLCPPWYEELHQGIRIERLDLKSVAGAMQMRDLLGEADIFFASQRPSALARLRLDPASLAEDFPNLRHVHLVGDTSDPEKAGHDLTYQALAGLLRDRLPVTLMADMAGAERAHAALKDVMHHPGAVRVVGLFDALRDLAAPLYRGLTGDGRPLGGSNPAYRIYSARDGAIAVAALEPHFRARLFEGLGLPDGADPATVFRSKTAMEWERWAAERDLPLVALKDPDDASQRA
jgi:crotonobetainyl-CoA:carnitine CoA-transferase CaiB-like acyl-CoA transferase